MKTNKRALLLSGYSRSGKTTVTSTIRLHYPDIAVVSTSEHLGKMAISFLANLCSPEDAEQIINTKDDTRCQELVNLSVRKLKIQLAEQVVVPFFGRFDGLILPALRSPVDANKRLILMETIGGEEARWIQEHLVNNGYSISKANIRNTAEEDDGTRSLLSDAQDVWFSNSQWYQSHSRLPVNLVVKLVRGYH